VQHTETMKIMTMGVRAYKDSTLHSKHTTVLNLHGLPAHSVAPADLQCHSSSAAALCNGKHYTAHCTLQSTRDTNVTLSPYGYVLQPIHLHCDGLAIYHHVS
jgi:hypothetical protein